MAYSTSYTFDKRNQQSETNPDRRYLKQANWVYKDIGKPQWRYNLGSDNNSNNTFPDDSAYSTGGSSYNTVDSSYSQHYNSPSVQQRWLESSRFQDHQLRKNQPPPPYFSPDLDQLRFADEVDGSDSDTATETETDTELNTRFSGCSIDDTDMSYLPSYIRPVSNSPISVTSPTTTTVSLTNSRPTLTTTQTSGTPTYHSIRSPQSVNNSSPQISPRPIANNTKKPDKSGYVGYRENYVRQQKHKLCGRRSLDDRLKSLESGAAVKLQVCKGSQHRRKISGPTTEGESRGTDQSHNDIKSKNDSVVENNDIVDNTYDEEQVEPVLSRAPPPDIIESHQPKHSIKHIDNDVQYGGDIRLKFIESTPITIQDNNAMDPAETDIKLESNRIKPEPASSNWKPATSLKESIPPANKQIRNNEPLDNIKQSTRKHSKEEQLFSSRKIEWKEVSSDAYSAMQNAAGLKDNLKEESSNVEAAPPCSPKTAQRRDKPLNRPGAPPNLTFEVATETTVVPVELRSPRGESAVSMREKRNARMFVLPSSDDSESDNVMARFKQPSAIRPVKVVAPVKFVPSMLRKQTFKSVESVTSSSASSLGHNSRSVSRESADQTSGREEQRNDITKSNHRKTSRSPKRSNSKSRSKSRIRSNPPRRSNSEDPTVTSTGESDASIRSPATHKREKRASQHSRSEPSPRTSRHKHMTEYAELSNVKRTPKSIRRHADVTNLPSPRQQAVAHAVKFGYPGDEGTIPYIDENTSPTENQKPIHEPAQETADADTCRRFLPLSSGSRRGRARKINHRSSYMEAMESSDDLTPDLDTDGSSSNLVHDDTDDATNRGKIGRSTSADSILSSVDHQVNVVLREQKRSSSADRNSLKGVHRRSYQIATTNNLSLDSTLRTPSHKRQPSIRKLKNFFGEGTPQIVEAQADEGRRGSRARPILPPPTLDLAHDDAGLLREGFLCFKVATIEKGKRSSSQKSWKSVWAVLKDQSLYLCKDWRGNKLDPTMSTGASHPSPGGGQPPTHFQLEEDQPLNIQGSLVSIAYNYLKRKNVFKVTTCNGSEYLLQAEDREDMLAWINSIHLSGNHNNGDGEVTINEDLILRKTNQIESGLSLGSRSPRMYRKHHSPKVEKRATRKSRSPKPVRRMTVPVKDLDGSRRFKWRGSVNRIVRKFGQGQTAHGGTFEVHLEDCPPSQNNAYVPFVVDLCCRIVEERGLSFTGIYRVPGNSGTLTALQEELNLRGPDGFDITDERFCELNVVSSLLKSFFRKLPDPLFSNELYDDFIAMNRKKDPEERLNGLRRLVHMLPAPHYQTLKFLISHLRKVADNCDVNKMEVRNLAIVFGPTLVRSTISDNMATMVTDMSDQCRIVESVLQHAAWFFTEDETEESSAPVPEEKDHEPVPNINHLLVNVGRTPGDASDSASDSSKSKMSGASEKESFSRDVMEMIFGPGKRWKNQPTSKDDGSSGSEDEYGFKAAKRKLSRASELDETPPAAPKYQVSAPAASHIRSAWPQPDRHLPPDIPSRLHDFYVEHLERLARTDVSRPLPNFSSSSTDTSPQVTPRSSLFGPPNPRPRPIPTMHQPTRIDKPYVEPTTSHPQPTHLHPKPRTYTVDAKSEPLPRKNDIRHFQAALATSTPVRQSTTPQCMDPTDHEVSSISKCKDEDSDSDTSLYVGDTLEEKLKNLTNLNKKLERRPSKRYERSAVEPERILEFQSVQAQPFKVSKRLTGPSMKAGELITPGNVHVLAPKKTTRELYQERKNQRQHNREQIRANRGNKPSKALRYHDQTNLTRCVSDENVFSRFDPKRQVVRPPHNEPTAPSQTRRTSRPGEKVKRRHTLGANDFPDQEFWRNPAKDAHASLQNVSREGVGSAMLRLNPKHVASRNNSVRPGVVAVTWQPRPATRKNESYL